MNPQPLNPQPPARFITIGFSHFCEKARWAMDHRGFPYREESHAPGFHRLVTRPLSARGTVPVLLVGARRIVDSADILQHVDDAGQRGAPLLPATEPARAECLAWEARFDKELGPHTRRLLYYHLLRERDLALRLIGSTGAAWERAAMPWVFPALRLVMRRVMRIDAEGAQRSREKIDAVFADVAARLAGGHRYLVGDQFSAADLTFAALAAPVLFPKEYAQGAADLFAQSDFPPDFAALVESYRNTPAGRFALRLYAEQRAPGQRPISA